MENVPQQKKKRKLPPENASCERNIPFFFGRSVPLQKSLRQVPLSLSLRPRCVRSRFSKAMQDCFGTIFWSILWGFQVSSTQLWMQLVRRAKSLLNSWDGWIHSKVQQANSQSSTITTSYEPQLSPTCFSIDRRPGCGGCCANCKRAAPDSFDVETLN